MVNKKLLKNLEANRNSIEELSGYVDAINSNAWTLTYMYPEDFGPAKFPDNHSFPTSISTHRMIKQFKPNADGQFVIYYSPINEAFASYFNPAKTINTSLNLGETTEYIVYADSSSGALPLNGNYLQNASTWATVVRPATKFQNFKMLRVVGASIEIFVDDVAHNFSGFIEGGVSFAMSGQGIGTESIDLQRLQNFSNFTRFPAKSPTVFRYRAPNINFMQFGPYEPFTQIPYFIISGKGLSSTATVGIVMTNHVEGVFWPEMAHFAYKSKFQQIQGAQQYKAAEESPHNSAMEEQKNQHITDRVSQVGHRVGDVKYYHSFPIHDITDFTLNKLKDPEQPTIKLFDTIKDKKDFRQFFHDTQRPINMPPRKPDADDPEPPEPRPSTNEKPRNKDEENYAEYERQTQPYLNDVASAIFQAGTYRTDGGGKGKM